MSRKPYEPWKKDTYKPKKSWKGKALKWGARILIPAAIVAYDYVRTESVNAYINSATSVSYKTEDFKVITDEGIFRNDKELWTFKGQAKTENLQSKCEQAMGNTVHITYNGWNMFGMRPNIRNIEPVLSSAYKTFEQPKPVQQPAQQPVEQQTQ